MRAASPRTASITWLVLLVAVRVHAACDVIPAPVARFDGVAGSLDRPYAGPGDYVSITTRAACSPEGFSDDADDHVVVVVFTPPRRASHGHSSPPRRTARGSSRSCRNAGRTGRPPARPVAARSIRAS